MSSAVKFAWSKPERGFEWVKARQIGEAAGEVFRPLPESAKASDFLVPRTPVNVACQPLENPGLFRRFCEIEPKSESSILEFADCYGWLGLALPVIVDGHETWGETSASWTHEIWAMRDALRTWDAVAGKDTKVLRSVIQWRNKKPLGTRGSELKPSFTFAGQNCRFGVDDPAIISQLNEGDVIGAALTSVNVLINRKLKEHSVIPQLQIGTKQGDLSSTILLTPKTLISSIWVQFAYVVEGKKIQYQCEMCRQWFEGGAPGLSRSDKRFCAPTCKARAHRIKQQRAREMHLAGTPVSEIANELETKTQTVKGWIK